MTTQNQIIHRVAVDLGFGGFKVAEILDDHIRVDIIPSVVGVGTTEIGLMSTGLKNRRRRDRPFKTEFDGISYLIGPNVHLYAQPVERLDFHRLSEGPELRALLYTSLWRVLGKGQHQAALLVGLPVEIVKDGDLARDTLRRLRAWLVGQHHFTVDQETVDLDVVEVKAIAQPVGTYFAWGMGTNGKWIQRKEAMENPVAVCDIGFNTLDLFAVENGEIVARYTDGDNLGMHRAADNIINHVRRTHGISLSLHQADGYIREYLNRGSRNTVTFYHSAGETDLSPVIEQALDETFANIDQFIRRHWERGLQFRYLIITGGGAEALKSRLIERYPQAIILPDAATANARGLAKFAARPKCFSV